MSSATTSKVRRKKDASLSDEHEWENHWLLRVPESYADRIRQFCNTQTSKDRLKIRFNQDQRHGTLQVGQKTLHFTVYDLPCIVEVLKTIDKVNMFKVNDLSQMLLCTEEPQPMPAAQSPPTSQPTTSADTKSVEETETEAQLAKQKREKIYQYPHGILPPLKNVRKRRFRKTKKKKYMDKPEVDKEVKRLFRDDLSAVEIRYEIVTVDDGAASQKSQKEPKQSAREKEDESNDLLEEAQRDLFAEAQQDLNENTDDQSMDVDQVPPQHDLMDAFNISSSEDEDDD